MVGRGGSKQQLTAARHIMAPGMQPRCRAVPRAPLSQSLYYALQPLPTRWTFFPSPSLARALSLSLFFFSFCLSLQCFISLARRLTNEGVTYGLACVERYLAPNRDLEQVRWGT